MSILSREVYERKQAYANKRNRANAEIDTLTEEQHEALAELCRIRHELHCNQDDVFNSESCEYAEFRRNFRDDGNVFRLLDDVDLPRITVLDISELPCSDDYYESLDADERTEWEERAELVNSQSSSTMKHTGFSIWVEESGDYAFFRKRLEVLNKQIEDYLMAIDEEHGTTYCPTGNSRI